MEREDVLNYGLSFPDTYQDAPFRDVNWQHFCGLMRWMDISD